MLCSKQMGQGARGGWLAGLPQTTQRNKRIQEAELGSWAVTRVRRGRVLVLLSVMQLAVFEDQKEGSLPSEV